MKLRNDVVLGRGLIIIGGISAWVFSLFFVLSNEPIPINMLIASALIILIGLTVIFFDFVEDGLKVKNEIEKFPQLIEDDIEELKKGKITPTHLMVLITLVTLVSQIVITFLFRKWQAYWLGSVSVIFVAVLAGFLVAFVGARSNWFQIRKHRLSWWVFLIPLIFYGLSTFLGIFFVEPKITSARGLPISQSSEYQYSWLETRSNQISFFDTISIMDGGVDMGCDDEVCLVILLVIVGILCVIASAVIPHFWVVATTILWVIMALVALRELLYSEAHRPQML